MTSPLVSVVIPAYKQADFVGQAIQSVLNQTYTHFELFVVNDASPDITFEVVNSFNDHRVNQIVHPRNRGLPASRNSGMHASSGEVIAFLDADDYFHPNKLETHINYLQKNPDIGVSYNSRYELNHSAETIRELWIPPLQVDLKDLVLGFPFSPSDTVVRRHWVEKVNYFDESYIRGGEDTDFPSRLALAGCTFGGVNKALTYRRYHSGRKRKDLFGRLNDVRKTQAATFSDPRCPKDVLAIRPLALKHHLMVLVSLALIQEETDVGHDFTCQLVQLDPTVIQGVPCELVEFLLMEAIADENIDHEEQLALIFDQLPDELSHLRRQYEWATAYGFLHKGVRNIIWGRSDIGSSQLEKAGMLNAACDEVFLQRLIHQLLGYEKEFGLEKTELVIKELLPYLEMLGTRKSARHLVGTYSVNLAFRDYQSHDFRRVPAEVARAVANDPSFLTNRGVLSIFFRSLFSRKKQPAP